MARFTVDTHLFRELGELLVGRDSTALIELIKNSYDADATEVIVHGESLADPRKGRIVILDNGTGMTKDRFMKGFLRIASRLKDQGPRRSSEFGRRFTGVKGIGRLAAHKLAKRLEVTSVHQDELGDGHTTELNAVLDWDAIEAYETLDDIPDDVVTLSENRLSRSVVGTALTLSSLRRPWTSKERARFFAEVQAFQTPDFITRPLPAAVVSEPVLFERPILRDASGGVAGEGHGGFEVLLEGELEAGDDYWGVIAELAAWVIEIRTAEDGRLVHIGVVPTSRTLDDNSDARAYSTTIEHPDPEHGPSFDARILVREGQIKGRGSRERRSWAAKASGIRVYLEGFRVLPYGDDDWLSIDADYAQRPRQLEMLKNQPLATELEDADPDEGLVRLPHNNYFGGVFLTQERAPTLRVLVNREGFVPESGFDTLVSLVRTGVDLCTRVRAASNLKARLRRRKERRKRREVESASEGGMDPPTTDKGLDRSSLPDLIAEAGASIGEARRLVSQGNADAAQPKMREAVEAMEEARERADSVISEGALFRVLASVGTQMAAFAHEMNALLGAAQTLREGLRMVLDDQALSATQRRRVRLAWAAAVDLAQWIERHASYLVDVTTPDARRRRSRQLLAARFDAAVRLVNHSAKRRRVRIDNDISPDAKTLPMFPAELTTVFANLLTNAVKSAREDGRIQALAANDDGALRVRVQNTGVAVDLEEAERWFEPFESTTEEVDPVLGQGMGLGLTITRSILDYYGVSVTFVDPDPAYDTAIEMAFPK
ncbi:MAG: sensor histidine kinase [Bryobacterales bacterium]|nr:sensor histidine kinase [Bryobacterales bacterium]